MFPPTLRVLFNLILWPLFLWSLWPCSSVNRILDPPFRGQIWFIGPFGPLVLLLMDMVDYGSIGPLITLAFLVRGYFGFLIFGSLYNTLFPHRVSVRDTCLT